MKEHIRILVAEDHPVVPVGLRGTLAGLPDFEAVGEAVTGAEAVEPTDRLRPEVVLIVLG